MLDAEHAPLKVQPKHDENNYTLGSIGDHNVAIACLAEYGTVNSAVAAKSMQSTFPNLRFGLMVGIGGGIPSQENDIRLGDIVVSLPSEQGGGVIQYDLGKQQTGGFRRVGALNKPPKLLRTAVNTLRATKGIGRKILDLVNQMVDDGDDDDESDEEWTRPTEEDILFKASYEHIGRNLDCCECAKNVSEITVRNQRKSTVPRVHYGNIASGNKVIKNGTLRDGIAEKENVICFEMEAAGLMDDFPCLVIRGISDYADSHKNWKWQQYAAATAAAYAKTLLSLVTPQAVDSLEPVKRSE